MCRCACLLVSVALEFKLTAILDNPKSDIFAINELPQLVNSTFGLLISLWIMCFKCKYRRPTQAYKQTRKHEICHWLIYIYIPLAQSCINCTLKSNFTRLDAFSKVSDGILWINLNNEPKINNGITQYVSYTNTLHLVLSSIATFQHQLHHTYQTIRMLCHPT